MDLAVLGGAVDEQLTDNLIGYTLYHCESPSLVKRIIPLIIDGSVFSSWEEVRVSTLRELSNWLAQQGAANPGTSAQLIKKILDLLCSAYGESALQSDENTEEFLNKLPSKQIRNYAAFLLGKGEAPWESNTERFLSRYYGSNEAWRLKAKYKELAVQGKHYHKTIIAFAKRVCSEKPDCSSCPVAATCQKEYVKM